MFYCRGTEQEKIFHCVARLRGSWRALNPRLPGMHANHSAKGKPPWSTGVPWQAHQLPHLREAAFQMSWPHTAIFGLAVAKFQNIKGKQLHLTSHWGSQHIAGSGKCVGSIKRVFHIIVRLAERRNWLPLSASWMYWQQILPWLF